MIDGEACGRGKNSKEGGVRGHWKKPIVWAVAALSVAAFSGCLLSRTPAREIRYFTLEYEAPGPSAAAPLPAVVRVSLFGAAPEYDTRNMVYQDGAFARNQDTYNRWRARPGDMAVFFLARDISRSGLFRAVTTLDGAVTPTHVLEGMVTEFFERESAGKSEAVVGLAVTLVEAGQADLAKQVALSKEYHAVVPMDDRSASGAAAAMSKAFAQVSGELRRDMRQALAGWRGEK
jgi:ABC-type uncharacterized transport system auxiliary subunit